MDPSLEVGSRQSGRVGLRFNIFLEYSIDSMATGPISHLIHKLVAEEASSGENSDRSSKVFLFSFINCISVRSKLNPGHPEDSEDEKSIDSKFTAVPRRNLYYNKNGTIQYNRLESDDISKTAEAMAALDEEEALQLADLTDKQRERMLWHRKRHCELIQASGIGKPLHIHHGQILIFYLFQDIPVRTAPAPLIGGFKTNMEFMHEIHVARTPVLTAGMSPCFRSPLTPSHFVHP